MSRPLYETQADRDNEQDIAGIVEARFNCTLHKMPMKYTLDFAAVRNDAVVAFIEARQRKIPSTQYSEYMISMNKLTAAHMLTQTTGLPCRLVIRWSDNVTKMIQVPPKDYDIRIGGSTRRNDWQDIEPLAYFKIADMKDISE